MSNAINYERIARMIFDGGVETRRFIEAYLNHFKEHLMSDLTKLSASVDALTAQAAVNTKAIADLVVLAPSFDRMRPDHAAEKRVKMQAALAAALYGGSLKP